MSAVVYYAAMSLDGYIAEADDTIEWLTGSKPCWVLSSRELPQPDGGEVTVVNGSVTELYDEMLAAAGERKLWVVGGGNVASQFADGGLLDEVWVTVVPVVLGMGKPLFDSRLPGAPLRLTAALPRPSGMIELRYEVRGREGASGPG